MSCVAHRECPTFCRDWMPCIDQPCDHDACREALAFGAFLDAEKTVVLKPRPHILTEFCWCQPVMESFLA